MAEHRGVLEVELRIDTSELRRAFEDLGRTLRSPRVQRILRHATALQHPVPYKRNARRYGR